ncbi:hypothetical protein V6N12_021135 [Hibiscus sabdariffa]|uniref:Uncharacterized protein n=1 Tax=Hibiscus sabdariffa TaxID=183260 RepID=A0ABR2AEV2_9ROSI
MVVFCKKHFVIEETIEQIKFHASKSSLHSTGNKSDMKVETGSPRFRAIRNHKSEPHGSIHYGANKHALSLVLQQELAGSCLISRLH